MVGYKNTLPFLYGLESRKDRFELLLNVPSSCLQYFDSGEADVALVPVGAILGREDIDVITNFCIGCEGKVHTVCLSTNDEIKNLNKVYLDAHSRTSQLLVKTLLHHYWKQSVEFEEVEVDTLDLRNLEDGAGVLMIGDKVFTHEKKFRNNHDLGQVWEEVTGLPFVFAVWIAKENQGGTIEDELNQVLKIGLDDIPKVVKHYQGEADKTLINYLENNIDFNFTPKKRNALKLFQRLVNEL